mgnify:FL=1
MTKPIPFKRGTTFSFVLEIPSTTVDGFFMDWGVKAQIRKQNNDNASGLIADLTTSWVDAETTRNLILSFSMTDKWPLGIAEVDVLYTAPSGQRMRSHTITFNIERDITQ